jgi:hypothetical protein
LTKLINDCLMNGDKLKTHYRKDLLGRRSLCILIMPVYGNEYTADQTQKKSRCIPCTMLLVLLQSAQWTRSKMVANNAQIMVLRAVSQMNMTRMLQKQFAMRQQTMVQKEHAFWYHHSPNPECMWDANMQPVKMYLLKCCRK